MAHPIFEEVARLREEKRKHNADKWFSENIDKTRKWKREWARKKREAKRDELEQARCVCGCNDRVVTFHNEDALCRPCWRAVRAIEALPLAAKQYLVSTLDVF